MSVESTAKKADPDPEPDFGDVLMTEAQLRSVVALGSGTALYSNIPEAARRIHDVTKQDAVRITTTTTGIFVEPLGAGGGVDELEAADREGRPDD
jgi:hypothetical protein